MGNLRGGSSREERKSHINVLELKAAAKLAIMKKVRKSIHARMDNMVALSYLIKMGGTKNRK